MQWEVDSRKLTDILLGLTRCRVSTLIEAPRHVDEEDEGCN
jgi:hypothetical protein